MQSSEHESESFAASFFRFFFSLIIVPDTIRRCRRTEIIELSMAVVNAYSIHTYLGGAQSRFGGDFLIRTRSARG